MTTSPRTACGLLGAFAIAAMCPAASAQLPDPSLTGGVTAPAIEALEAPEPPAVELPALEAPSVEAPSVEAPPVDVPALMGVVPGEAEAPENVAPSGGAKAPAVLAAEPEPAAVPAEPAAEPPISGAPEPPPGNLNIDIRILSPGDDGHVVQEIVMPGRDARPHGREVGGGPAAGAGPGSDWDWNWTWSCGSGGPSTAAAGGSWDWNWHWDCGMSPEQLFEDAELVAATPLSTLIAPEPEKPPDRAQRRDRAAGSGGAPVKPRSESPIVFATAVGPAIESPRSSGPASQPEPPRPEPVQTDTSDPEPLSFAPPLVAAAGSSAPPGGAPSLLLVVLAGLLCLLAPRTAEPAFQHARKLRSLIGAERLERPG